MEEIKVISVNISEKKGTLKTPVTHIDIGLQGVAGDAHSGIRNREVSLLAVESIRKMEPAIKRPMKYGEFAENITTEGFPVHTMLPLDRLKCGSLELEVTQIGKKCHGERCEIFRQTGDCIMPKEGIFCRVINSGSLKAGDVLQYIPRVIRCGIITLSDRASRGDYEDRSGPLITRLISEYFENLKRKSAVENILIPDERDILRETMNSCIGSGTDIIFTTGGTGIGPRDITPEVIRPMLDKEIPGIMEMIRVKYGMQMPNALISRSFAGIVSNSLIFALPGSPKAVSEYMTEILPTVEHSLMMMHGIDKHK